MLRPCQRPIPQPGPNEVLIHAHAAGVNRPDIMQRRGLYPPPPGASDLPGLEVAGEIVAVGGEVRTLRAGDRVCALLNGGGYAEYCAASAELCLPIPAGFDYIQAASLPEAAFTVWANVFELGHLQAGESLLIHGGSSGIGVMAIQLAKAFGANVFATVGNSFKFRACEALGAVAIDYTESDFAGEIKVLTHDRGVDVIVDMVGGDYLQRNLDCLAAQGRLVQIGVQNGVKAQLNLWTVMQKRLTITGSTLRPRSAEEKAAIAARVREKIWPLLESGAVKPVIHQVFPLPEAAEAHRLMESSAHIGKLVLEIG
jgi:putative PIG3 family NAD(P)H quinone oxidoreductase